MALSGKFTKRLDENLGAGRYGDGNCLYHVVDPSGAWHRIPRVVVKGQKNKIGAPLWTDFGLGGADVANVPREVAEMSLAHRVGSEVELAYQRSHRLQNGED